MPSGPLRELLTIEQPRETIDSEGQPIKAWTEIFQPRSWGQVEFLSGRELEDMQKINTAIELRMTVYYRTDITTKMRIRWRDQSWNIHAILPDERTAYMSLLASKVE